MAPRFLAMLQVLRPGVRHEQVELWEEFLLGYGFYSTVVDTLFNDDSVESTKLFQEEHGLKADGWVGKNTWAKAIELGLDVLESADDNRDGPNWPPKPEHLSPIVGTEGRMEVWGKLEYRADPSPGNPEGITILNDWAAQNVVSVPLEEVDSIPGITQGGQLVGGGPKVVTVHRLVRDTFVELWRQWKEAGLLKHVITWAGTWNPRFVRGSRTNLSNHAFATAFDINAPWNGLRRTPALTGERGCVRDLVGIANALGWYWGGHFKRRDGMHFEATEEAIQ